MLDLRKYNDEVIDKFVKTTESDVVVSQENKSAIVQLNKLQNVETNFDTEVKRIYDKQYIRDAIKDLFIKYDFSYDLKNIVELKILGFRNFQIAEKVGKGAQSISNALSKQEVKDFFNDLSALRIADNTEKISIGNSLAINKVLELMNSKDERVSLAASKIFIELNKDSNQLDKKFSSPNNAVALDVKRLGYKSE
jgi:hypothetical protein